MCSHLFSGYLGDVDACLFSHLEEGIDGYTLATPTQAVGILLVALGGVVFVIKLTELMIDFPTVFAQTIGQGKPQFEPVIITGGDIDSSVYELSGHFLYFSLSVGLITVISSRRF